MCAGSRKASKGGIPNVPGVPRQIPGGWTPEAVSESATRHSPKGRKAEEKAKFSEILALSLAPFFPLKCKCRGKCFFSFALLVCGKDALELRGTCQVIWARPRNSARGPASLGRRGSKTTPCPVAGTPDLVQCGAVWHACVPENPLNNTRQRVRNGKQRICRGKGKTQNQATEKLVVSHEGS